MTERRRFHKSDTFWRAAGGRKQVNAYIFVILGTIMAIKLQATFPEYAMYMGIALLGTSAIVAIEDNKKKATREERRGQPPTDPPETEEGA